MKVSLNSDTEIVSQVKEGLRQSGGYCPCRLQRNEDTKCMCAEFRAQLEDEEFYGECHCGLYIKSK